MKKTLSLILITGTFPVFSLFLMTKPASAYCVYNRSGTSIYGKDTRRTGALIDRHWEKVLDNNAKDCCPGDYGECQNATIQIKIPTFPMEKAPMICQVKLGARQALVVYKRDNRLACKVN